MRKKIPMHCQLQGWVGVVVFLSCCLNNTMVLKNVDEREGERERERRGYMRKVVCSCAIYVYYVVLYIQITCKHFFFNEIYIHV